MLSSAPINLKQLAHQLGLSSSTVSRALRDSYEISPATRERVQQLARKVNYQPNPIASNLRSHVSKTIGVVLPQVDNHFFASAIDGIEEVAQAHGYHVLIYLTHDKAEQEKTVASFLGQGRVDGILVALASATRSVGHFDKLRQLGMPIVQFDRVNRLLDTATVTTDDYGSAYQATEHLLRAGCRTIAHLRLTENLSIRCPARLRPRPRPRAGAKRRQHRGRKHHSHHAAASAAARYRWHFCHRRAPGAQ
jgi:LacI family transcriptional regulator